MKFSVLLLLSVVILQGCDLFSTRSPEEPDASGTIYKSPVSPENVISNFENSIENKNAEVYISCFYKSEVIDDFSFYPSTDALALYPGLFGNWSLDEERRYINTMIANLQTDEKPELEWLNFEFKQYPPDSSLFFADYMLKIPVIDQNQDFNIFEGKLQFTIIVDDNGEWSIKRWYDFTGNQDSLNSTWSILKAENYN